MRLISDITWKFLERIKLKVHIPPATSAGRTLQLIGAQRLRMAQDAVDVKYADTGQAGIIIIVSGVHSQRRYLYCNDLQ